MIDFENKIILGDCLEFMKGIPDKSFNALICDPPYPCIKRAYGTMTESEWRSMMDVVITEGRRILTPDGSMMFVLQHNFYTTLLQRPWLWRFIADYSEKWFPEFGIIQDVYWINVAPMVNFPAIPQSASGFRSCVKNIVWLGSPNCKRNQKNILWNESDGNKLTRLSNRLTDKLRYWKSGAHTRENKMSANEKVTPYNIFPIAANNGENKTPHPAKTPLLLLEKLVLYLTDESDMVLDPFMGSGTTAVACINTGRRYIGIEKNAEYHKIATDRVARALSQPRQLELEGV
jgi:DNA modification methylase